MKNNSIVITTTEKTRGDFLYRFLTLSISGMMVKQWAADIETKWILILEKLLWENSSSLVELTKEQMSQRLSDLEKISRKRARPGKYRRKCHFSYIL